jgi:hypothetical protein
MNFRFYSHADNEPSGEALSQQVLFCVTVLPMNPYASQLGNRNPLEVISATADQLNQLTRTIGAQRVEQPPAPGKWNAREIACHLADCEIVFAYRLRQALAEEKHVIQPFDQDQFAKPYRAYDLPSALAVFGAVRSWNVKLIRTLTPQQLAKPVNHPERGDMTVQTIVETMGGHDLNHLKQLEGIAARSTAA